jgi:transcriptional regulator with XRE-family HTH domain
MNERIKDLLKALGMRQSAFAERLNVSAAFVSELCSGRKAPSDRTISDICREFHVNEDWLRTGEGDMFVRLSTEEELAQYVAQVLTDPEQDIARMILRVMAHLDPSDWERIREVAQQIKQDL